MYLYKTTKLSNKSQDAFLPSSPTVPGTRRFLGSQGVLGVPLIPSLRRYLADRASPANQYQQTKSPIPNLFLRLYEQKVYNLQDLQANLQFQVGPAGQNRGQREPIVRRVRVTWVTWRRGAIPVDQVGLGVQVNQWFLLHY